MTGSAFAALNVLSPASSSNLGGGLEGEGVGSQPTRRPRMTGSAFAALNVLSRFFKLGGGLEGEWLQIATRARLPG